MLKLQTSSEIAAGDSPSTILPDADLVPRYGVKEQTSALCAADYAAEELRLLGYTVVDPGFSGKEQQSFSRHFDSVAEAYFKRHGGRAALRAMDEHNTIRAMLTHDELFLQLAKTPAIFDICCRLLGDVFILNQQNGIVNPADGAPYNQALYHRDLPYQHFVCSRPLAINALYCVDAFTIDNGATTVVPGSHKQEAFPSDEVVRALQTVAVAPAGSFIVLDCMTFHRGGRNFTKLDRRAVNHVFTLPFIKQQVLFGEDGGYLNCLNAADRKFLDLDSPPAVGAAGYLTTRRKRES